MTIVILSWKYNTNTNFLRSYLNEPRGYLMIVTSYLTLQSRLSLQKVKILEWNFGQFYVIWRHIWRESRLSRQKVNILEFWQLHCVPRVKICIYTNFQLNLIISWHSNTIWMTFWAILWYLTSYLTSQSRLNPSKILKYHNSDITIDFPSKKNSPLRSLRPTRSF